MPKIAFVGAGSVVFSKQLLVDIMSYPEFEGSIFSLMDIDADTSEEYAGVILHSLACGDEVSINGNVLNSGLIDNLPQGCCVEVPCLVNRNGIQPTRIGALPSQLAAYNSPLAHQHLLAAEAGINRSREEVYRAAMIDPLCSSQLDMDRIASLCDELFEAHRPLVGAYA